MEVLAHMDKATKAGKVFSLPAVADFSELVFYIAGETALIRSGAAHNPKYDFIWSTPNKTSIEVARERYAARQALIREGI